MLFFGYYDNVINNYLFNYDYVYYLKGINMKERLFLFKLIDLKYFLSSHLENSRIFNNFY